MNTFLHQTLNLSFDYMVFVYLFIFSAFFILFVFMLGVIYSRLKNKELDEEALKQEAYQKALRTLELARRNSLKLYKNSQKHAKKIIEEAYDFKDITKEDLTKYLQDLSKEQEQDFENYIAKSLEEFKTALNKGASKSVAAFSDVSVQLQEEAQEGLTSLKETVERETLASHEEVQKKIKEEYNQLQKELDTYKQTKLNEIDSHIGEIISDISTKVIGKTLPLADHKDFVLKVLEEEKEKGSFLM